MQEQEWAEVRAVDWTQFSGAYGTDKDVAAALETLRFGTDAEDDDFSDAFLDVLYGHVWHQGSIYPLTAKVLPFVFDIVDESAALSEESGAGARNEIVDLVMYCASAARRACESSDADERAVGAAVISALIAELPRLEAWKASDDERQRSAIVTMLNLPTLRDRVLSCKEHERSELLDTVLSATHVVGAPMLEWAARELAAIDHPVAARAARELREAAAEGTLVDQERFTVLAEALPSRLDTLRERFGIAAAST